MKYFIALAFFAVASAKRTQVAKIAVPKQCDGPWCPGGCCPNHGWLCCPDGMWCASTLDDCPSVAKKIQLKKMAAPKQCDCCPCPGGCCPMVGWECCPDNLYCAPTLDDCPVNTKKTQLAQLAAPKQCDGDGPACPGGCCPILNGYCCPDGLYCAATADDCPFAQH